MWSARQSRKMGRRVAGLLGGLLVGLLLAAAPAAAAFVDPINLSNSAAPSGRPAIAVNEVNGTPYVFAVWEEGINGQTNIVFARSQPCGGLQFGAPRILSAGPGASMPAVAANNSRGVFVVWQASSDVWMSRSTDNGETFLPPENLSNDATSSKSPSVATDEFGGIFVAWSDGSSPAQILFKRSTAGSGFDQAVRVSQTPSGNTSQAPAVAAGGGNVFVAWEEQVGPNFQESSIKYKKFASGIQLTDVAGLGATVLSAPLFRATGPTLAFGNGILSVAFRIFNAVYHRSAGPGPDLSFSEFSPLEPSFSGPATSPSIRPGAARGNGSAMVAWAQKPDLTATDTDIRHRLVGSTNGPEPVLTTAARRASPAAAIDSTGRLLVAWQETVNLNGVLNDEIYVSYSGGTGGGSLIDALVEMNPQTLNAKTMYQGEGVFTLRIRPLVGNAAEIDPLSLKFNDKEEFVRPLRWSLVDTDGNGLPDTLELKIKRSELQGVFDGATLTAAQGKAGSYDADVKVKGNMAGRLCFSGKGDVRIINQ